MTSDDKLQEIFNLIDMTGNFLSFTNISTIDEVSQLH